MGNIKSKNKDDNILHLINYNANNLPNSIYSNNIIDNITNKKQNIIFCFQGLREKYDKENKTLFISEDLGLGTYSNKNISFIKSNKFKSNLYDLDNKNYGYQQSSLIFNNNRLYIYNVEFIPDINKNINTFDLREKQLEELLYEIYKNENKINLIFASINNYKNTFKKLINISNISNIMNLDSDNSFIFIYSKKFLDDINKLNNFLYDEFKIEILEESIYSSNEVFPFEVIIKLKKK